MPQEMEGRTKPARAKARATVARGKAVVKAGQSLPQAAGTVKAKVRITLASGGDEDKRRLCPGVHHRGW